MAGRYNHWQNEMRPIVYGSILISGLLYVLSSHGDQNNDFHEL